MGLCGTDPKEAVEGIQASPMVQSVIFQAVINTNFEIAAFTPGLMVGMRLASPKEEGNFRG